MLLKYYSFIELTSFNLRQKKNITKRKEQEKYLKKRRWNEKGNAFRLCFFVRLTTKEWFLCQSINQFEIKAIPIDENYLLIVGTNFKMTVRVLVKYHI